MTDIAISAPAMKGLMSLDKKVLAQRVLDLHAELARERARQDEVAAAEREACAALVEPKEPCPCDCDGLCYCMNSGDLRQMMDWLTSTALAKAIRERA